MRHSSEIRETKGGSHEDLGELTGKERRRLQNRIAQRNHRKRKRSESARDKLCEHYLEGMNTRIQAAQQNTADRWFRPLSTVPMQEPLSPQSPLRPYETPNSCDNRLLCSDHWASRDRRQSDSLIPRFHTQSVKGTGCTPSPLDTWRDNSSLQQSDTCAGAHSLESIEQPTDTLGDDSNFSLRLKGIEPGTSGTTVVNQLESSVISMTPDSIFQQDEKHPEKPPIQTGLGFHDHISTEAGGTLDSIESVDPHDNDGNCTAITSSLPELFGTSGDSKAEGNLAGKTALHLSAENGHCRVVRCLLGFGSNVNARDSSGATALHYAAKMGSVNVIEALLERGGNANMVDQHGQTPLHMAARNGHEAAVHVLVQSGVCVDVQIQSSQYYQQKCHA